MTNIEITQEQREQIGSMLLTEGWLVMKQILEDIEREWIEKLRTTNPEANKIEYTEHDIVRATINLICKIKNEPYTIVE